MIDGVVRIGNVTRIFAHQSFFVLGSKKRVWSRVP